MGTQWISVDIDSADWGGWPRTPAVYVIYIDGRFAYVGSTNSIANRMSGYKIDIARYSNTVNTPWGDCSDLTIKYRTYKKFGMWLMQEARLIRRLKPRLNKNGIVGRRLKAEAANA